MTGTAAHAGTLFARAYASPATLSTIQPDTRHARNGFVWLTCLILALQAPAPRSREWMTLSRSGKYSELQPQPDAGTAWRRDGRARQQAGKVNDIEPAGHIEDIGLQRDGALLVPP